MSRRSEVAQISRRGYWKEADARVVVEAWRSGGETLSKFAARYGVDAKRIARWEGRVARIMWRWRGCELSGHKQIDGDCHIIPGAT